MKKFIETIKNNSIQWKLNLMVKISVALMSILGLGALFGAWELNHQTKVLHDEWMNANNIIAELDYLTSQVRLEQYGHVISSNVKEFETREQNVANLIEQINVLIAEYEKTISSER